MRHVWIAVLAVFVILFTAWRVQNPRSMASRNGQSGAPPIILQGVDPFLMNAYKMRGIPILLITSEKDRRLPTNQQALALASIVGPSCQRVTVSGATDATARLLDGQRIKAFLAAHRNPRQITVVVNPQELKLNMWSFLDKKERYGLFSTHTVEFTNTSLPSSLDTRYAKEPDVAFVCEGPGAKAVWQYAERYPKNVACIVAISPVTSFAARLY